MLINLRNAMMSGAGLPYDAELEYLESTGTQYIDTGIKLRSTDTIDTRLYINSSSTGAWYGILGSRDSARYLILRCYVGKDYVVNALSPNHDYDFNRFTWGDLSFTFGGDYHESATNCYLFTYNNNGTGYTRLPYRIANFSITRDGSKLIDYIPVRVGSGASAVGYMYDRVSKRLFGNAGTGAFVLGPDKAVPILSLHRYASPSNGVALGKMGCTDLFHRITAKDYVQSGLVAMWDGIENAGWGVHDAIARTWKNLVGDIDLPLDDYPSQIYFTSNSLYTSNGRLAERQDVETIDGPITYEVCWVRVNKFNQSADTRCNYGQCNLDIFNGQFWYKTSSDGGIMSPVNGRAQESVPFTMSVVGTMGGSWQTLIPYVNATQISGSKYSSSISTQGIHIGSGWSVPISKHHNIRVYSRALTADEIAHNYNIDKARFGLP